jgi:hypothetical protein
MCSCGWRNGPERVEHAGRIFGRWFRVFHTLERLVVEGLQVSASPAPVANDICVCSAHLFRSEVVSELPPEFHPPATSLFGLMQGVICGSERGLTEYCRASN